LDGNVLFIIRLDQGNFVVIFRSLNGGINDLNLWEEVIEVISTWLIDGGSAHEIAFLSFDEGSVKVIIEDWLVDNGDFLDILNNSLFALKGEKIGKANVVWRNIDNLSLNSVLWDK